MGFILSEMATRNPCISKFTHPGREEDLLSETHYDHNYSNSNR
jgi:hypothetical protein